MGDLKLASVSASRVVDVNHKVGSLTSHKESLTHRDLQSGHLASNETNLFLEWNHHIELRVIDKRPHR